MRKAFQTCNFLLLKNQFTINNYFKLLDVSVLQSSNTMSQKSLLSFFKTVNSKVSNNETDEKENNKKQQSPKNNAEHQSPKKNEKPQSPKKIEKQQSPIKTKKSEETVKLADSPVLKKKRRRIAVLSSDSEEEITSQHQNKKICTDASDIDEGKEASKTEVKKEDSKTEVNDEEKAKSKTSSPSNDKNAKQNMRTPDSASKKLSTVVTEQLTNGSSNNRGKLSDILKKKPSKKKTPKKSVTTSKTPSKTVKENSKNAKQNSSPVETPEKITTESKSSDDEVEQEDNTPIKKAKTKKVKAKKDTTKNTILSNNTKTDDLDTDAWKYGQKTPYLNFAKTLQQVEETSARLKIIDILSNYFRNVIMSNKADLLPSIYLCLNTLGPAYEGVELGIAETYLMKAVAQCTGRTLAQIKADAAKTGDLGVVAEQSRSNQKIMFHPPPLTVQGVFNQLSEIASITGHNSVQKKIDKIQSLFVACRECEARFLIRSLVGKLRIGLAEQSVLQALALACTTTPPNQEDPISIKNAAKTMSADEFKKQVSEELLILKTTYCECPNFNLIVPVLLKEGLRSLPEHCKITPGIPVKPMLAQPTKGVHEVLKRFEDIKFTCEWKYDGERAQIHLLDNGTIQIYSRNQEDNTSKYPDVIQDIRQVFKSGVKSCILDAEAVAWDRELKKIMPFQILSTRKRKDADVGSIKVRVCAFLFDILYLNGESLTQKTLAERRNLLKEHMQEVEEKFTFVKSIDTNTMEEVQECLEESVKGNCEGLMVKTLDTDATYEIAKRSRNWLKLKKDYLEGCGDTLDLVVIGGYIGKGKRTGQYGGFLLASYNADNDEYQTICKIGTGFTEEALATHSEFLKQHLIPKAKPYYRYDPAHEPDQWFDAVQVWEVKCADLSLSPIYYSAMGLVDQEKGISLRFPRFLRVRDDKSVEQATSSQQVAELYNNQDQIKNNAPDVKFNEEDF